MADIDIVLERLVTDTSFRAALADDPASALAAYDLSEQDLQLLAGSLDDGDDAQRGVEQRTSKSAMVGLLASLAGGGGPPPGADDAQRTHWWKLRGDSAIKNQSPIGVDDPVMSSQKYSSPINVASTTTIRTGAGPSSTSDLTGRPVGQPSAAGLGAHVSRGGASDLDPGEGTARMLNSKPTADVTIPISSNRAAEPVLPASDGAAKDSASLSQDAPPDDAASQHRDRPMGGEISVSRSVAPGGGEADQLAPPGANSAQSPWGGGPKHTPGRTDDLAPPVNEQAEEFVTHDIKNTRDSGKDPGLFAPKGVDEVSGREDARLESKRMAPGSISEQSPAAGDVDGDLRTAAPVPADYDGDGAAAIKIEIGAAGQRAPAAVAADDDFLTVEDE